MENEKVNNENLNFDTRVDLDALKNAVQAIKSELRKVIVGQDEFVELLIAALLADGHVLIEGVPGIAKTVTAKLFAKVLETEFSRIQFTPDLMPSDVLGTSVFNMPRACPPSPPPSSPPRSHPPLLPVPAVGRKRSWPRSR